ncbi:hypothetical protein ABZ654_33760, partial [Streptomyces hygroscopicus]|uniref:hypothetical protein n=1 Tax=Streptomyces hygroscopicus TaxID=1912 RepID=UPI00340280C7
ICLLGPEEGECQVDSFNFAEPLALLGPLAPQQEILLQLGEPGQHLWADLEHGASNAGVFVLAR